MTRRCVVLAAVAAWPFATSPLVLAQATVPPTISPEAAKAFEQLAGIKGKLAGPTPTTPEQWAARAAVIEQWGSKLGAPVLERLAPQVTEDDLGGVKVLRVKPRGGASSRRVLIYVHGGGYTSGSARSSLAAAALMADAADLEVVSVDYTIAPKGTWRAATAQVVAVYRGLVARNYRPASIGLFGESAGGGLVAGSVLLLRDENAKLPGAVVLQSPWSDITGAGDSYATLAAADPVLDLADLQPSADVYAAPSDQRLPYVSPVYGSYAKGFPPTLIQGGTREIFLSNFVRQYRAIEDAGGVAVLDLYEGMPHVFQVLMPETPEAQAAYAKAAAFWHEHLK